VRETSADHPSTCIDHAKVEFIQARNEHIGNTAPVPAHRGRQGEVVNGRKATYTCAEDVAANPTALDA
jgi:hypothetical protein